MGPVALLRKRPCTKVYCYFVAAGAHLYVDLCHQTQMDVVVRGGFPSATSSAVLMSSGAAMVASVRVIDIIRFVTCALTWSFLLRTVIVTYCRASCSKFDKFTEM
jgi:hypothetical protein